MEQYTRGDIGFLIVYLGLSLFMTGSLTVSTLLQSFRERRKPRSSFRLLTVSDRLQQSDRHYAEPQLHHVRPLCARPPRIKS